MSETPLKHIFLIDDEESVLFALRLLLEAIGYKVTPFSSGGAALVALEAQNPKPDFFISDLRMPELSGIEVLAKAAILAPDVTRILMSAHATNDEIDDAKQIGVTTILDKPFTVDELRAVLSSPSSDPSSSV